MWVTLLITAGVVAATFVAGFLIESRRSYLEWIKLGERQIKNQGQNCQSAALASIESLPQVVQRYLHRSLPIYQGKAEGRVWEELKKLSYVRLRQRGEFCMKAGGKFIPFKAKQLVSMCTPAFSWRADMRMIGPLSVTVCDRIVDGQAALQARLLSFMPVAKMSHSPELMQGELQRFLAEIPFYPAVILLLPGLKWKGIDEDTMEASLTVNDVTACVTLEFKGEGGLVSKAYTKERYFRHEDGSVSLMPWEAECTAYKSFQGFLLPSRAEVSWLLPEGSKFTYFKGEIVEYAAVA